MAGPPRPSFPSAPSEPSLRRLGVGRGGGGGDRPLRAQLVVALVVVLILIAVPLYLWRRPGSSESSSGNAGHGPDAAAAAASAAAGAAEVDAKHERVSLGQVQRVRCSASPTGQQGGVCDPLPFFDQALAKAIRENVDCAPRTGKVGTINYVLSIDFSKRQLHVYPGQSGEWRGPQARRATACVKKSLPTPDWDSIPHQYRYYRLAVLATYPPPTSAPLPGPPGAPVFE